MPGESDMYRPENGYRLPPESSNYSAAFVSEYRQAQYDRVRRLDAVALQHLADTAMSRRALREFQWNPDDALRLERRGAGGRFMTIYRTIADPGMVDMSIDPDDRFPGGQDGDTLSRSAELFQYGPRPLLYPRAGLARGAGSPRHASITRSLSGIADPTLIVHYTADWFARLRTRTPCSRPLSRPTSLWN